MVGVGGKKKTPIRVINSLESSRETWGKKDSTKSRNPTKIQVDHVL